MKENKNATTKKEKDIKNLEKETTIQAEEEQKNDGEPNKSSLQITSRNDKNTKTPSKENASISNTAVISPSASKKESQLMQE